ncbi:MAG: response regulator transcription factor [Aeromicrobium sp.]
MAVIAVCEDDAALRTAVRRALESAGHQIRGAATGHELMMVCETFVPDAIVLDIGLPDADGRDVCLALRARGVTTPILMLTALDGTHNTVAGFQSGADDYLTKPFDLVELEVRMTALLKRTSQTLGGSAGPILDPAAHTIGNEGTEVPLTPTEYKLMAHLMAHAGAVARRRELVGAGWPHGAAVSDNTLDSYVRRLRTKLANIDEQPHITTVRGIGYRWD